MTNVELNWEDPLPSYAIAKNRKNIQHVVCVGIGTPLLGDRWVTELARKDVKDQNHADIRTRCNDFAGYKVTSCVIFVRFVSVNKLWGKGLRSGLEKVLPTFRPKFPPVPRLAQPIGSHEEKIWTTEKLLQVLKRTFQKKMWGQVHSSDKKSNGEASFMDSQCVSACRALDVPRRELERRHLCRFIALAAPSSCNTRLHMLHVSKSRNNNNNSLLQAPPGDQIAHVAHLQRQQQQ